MVFTVLFFTIVYAGLLLFLRRSLDLLPQAGASPPPKSLSVIVCARNEAHNLPQLFKHLEAQHIPSGISAEFIIVNDRSDDGSASMIDRHAKNDPRFKALHINERADGYGPKKYAIEKAIKIAHGDVILLTDADGRPGPRWIASMLRFFDLGADMVLGYAPYTMAQSGRFIQGMLALEYFSHAAVAAASCGWDYPLTCVGTNMAYRRSVFEEIDGFGEYRAFVSGDDDLFLTRVREAGGYTISYATDPDSHVYNHPPRSLKQFVHQRLRYASKGFDYPFKVTVVLTFYVLFNMLLFVSPFAFLWGQNDLGWAGLLALTIKGLAEVVFLQQAAQRIGEKRLLRYYPLTAILHVPYVLFFGIAGQLKLFRWAEGRVEKGVVDENVTSRDYAS